MVAGQISSRPHTTDFPQKVAKKGNFLFHGNLGWWYIIIWPDSRCSNFQQLFLSDEPWLLGSLAPSQDTLLVKGVKPSHLQLH